MNHVTKLVGLGLLGLALLVSTGTTQEKGDKKAKGQLPAGFKDLGLSAEQKASIYKVIGEYKVKIDDLNKQINGLKKQQQQDIFKVLTDDQKKKYLESKGVTTKDKKDAK